MKTSHLLLLSVFFFYVLIGCKKKKKEAVSPESNAIIFATIGSKSFNGIEIEKTQDLGFTLKASEEKISITIGTAMPPFVGTYTLGKRDPFSGQFFFATYIDENGIEYRTVENAGALKITSVETSGDTVSALKGSFSFKAMSPNGKEVNVQNGEINY